jgi:pyrophosphatase PpaX
MNHIHTILFDLDGTLLDTTDLIVSAFQHVVRQHLNREITKEELVPNFGKPLIEAMEEISPGQSEFLVSQYRNYNRIHHDSMVQIFPDVVSTLEELHKKGIKMGIVTSKVRKTALQGLKLFNLDYLFDVFVGYEDTTIHKPNPEPVLFALKQVGVDAGNALMVGDSPHDIVSAKRAGTKTAAVTWSSFPLEVLKAEEPTYLIDQMSQLIDLIDNKL